jgi:ssDNA-binding Zn-finger/Zn-ribbon topoisomerase 1
MTIFLYRWKIKPGKEIQFEENWSVVTKAIRQQCGSYGSRLHVSENGDYIGCAQWPDAKTRESCELDPSSSKSRALMREAVEKSYPDEQFIVKADLLIEPYMK